MKPRAPALGPGSPSSTRGASDTSSSSRSRYLPVRLQILLPHWGQSRSCTRDAVGCKTTKPFTNPPQGSLPIPSRLFSQLGTRCPCGSLRGCGCSRRGAGDRKHHQPHVVQAGPQLYGAGGVPRPLLSHTASSSNPNPCCHLNIASFTPVRRWQRSIVMLVASISFCPSAGPSDGAKSK